MAPVYGYGYGYWPCRDGCTGPFASCCTNNKGRRTLLNPEARRPAKAAPRSPVASRQRQRPVFFPIQTLRRRDIAGGSRDAWLPCCVCPDRRSSLLSDAAPAAAKSDSNCSVSLLYVSIPCRTEHGVTKT